jgi:hypothetical protein
MPVRQTANKRRRASLAISPEAIEIFRAHHTNPTTEARIALAAALGRSKFAACPLDREPRSLIGQGATVEFDLRRVLLAAIGEADAPGP